MTQASLQAELVGKAKKDQALMSQTVQNNIFYVTTEEIAALMTLYSSDYELNHQSFSCFLCNILGGC